jgi:uncharacterized membrane protein YdfJ with MMPL/SSD domain
MKRPVSAVLVSLVILGVMAAPITGIKFSQGDSRMLPADNKAAFATAQQAERFPGQTGTPIEIIIIDGADKLEEINVSLDVSRRRSKFQLGTLCVLSISIRRLISSTAKTFNNFVVAN